MEPRSGPQTLSEGPVGEAEAALHRRLRERRLSAGLSQQELAERAGVQQSAISAFERHGSSAQALSAENIQQIATILGFDLSAVPAAGRSRSARLGLFFCPNPDCPSVLAYPVGERTLYRPRFVRAEAGRRLFCVDCGEICESRCPGCGALPGDRLRGAVCPECGTPYLGGGDDLAAGDLERRLAWQRALSESQDPREYRHGAPAAPTGSSALTAPARP
ncbi:MAG: helix-turn-helix domain-containing protein [Lentisphaerae bacterium]|nr:helix-turn-helix domain-containing protein [Lentisphaerota bacterium]